MYNQFQIYRHFTHYGKILVFLAIFILVISLNKKINRCPKKLEGFETGQKLLTVDSQSIYDPFYASIYDYLTHDPRKNQFELVTLLEQTNPSSDSIILDIGSGTGHHVHLFQKAFQCKTMGIDKSKSMVAKSQILFPDSTFSSGDVLNKNQYSYGQFTHITCLYYTIYYTEKKQQLLQNVYYWLMSGGYFVIHLVKRDEIVSTLPMKYVNDQDYNYNFKTKIDFNKFKYQSVFIPYLAENKAVIQENFIFDSGEKRKQEYILFFDDHETILRMARNVGFIVHSKIDMQDCDYKDNYLFILQKPL